MLKKAGLILLGIFGLLWLNNTSLFSNPETTDPLRLLAHRGVHQTFAGAQLDAQTCTANPVHPIGHGFIENTLPSMQAAFDAGAEVVELDIHLTPDGQFAVFHDWTLECRTDGAGQTNKTPYSVLKTLDVGFGYSADGTTYPLRGTGVGLIPTLKDVFDAFPNGRFLVNFKSNRNSEGKALAAYLLETPKHRDQVIGVYGGQKPTLKTMELVEGMPGYSKSSVKACILRYVAIGWSGIVPEACKGDGLLAVPVNVAPFLWGWPHKFQSRMAEAGTDIILVGLYSGGGFTSGIDTPDDLSRVPSGFSGYVWTNKIETIGPLTALR